MKIPQYIFIHHTAVSWKKNPDQWKATDAFHKAKGWGGGGYNAEVAANGSIHMFRQDGAPTAAQFQMLKPNEKPTYNMNDGRALSICMDGNFDIEDPTPEQKAAVATWLQIKMDRYKIPKENIFCHRRVAPKTCPGNRLPDNIYSYFLPLTPSPVIPDWAQSAVAKAKATGVITNWSNPWLVVGNEVLEFSLEKAGVLDPSKHEGFITLLRWAVILDKVGLL